MNEVQNSFINEAECLEFSNQELKVLKVKSKI